jgi:hypothetical protein
MVAEVGRIRFTNTLAQTLERFLQERGSPETRHAS